MSKEGNYRGWVIVAVSVSYTHLDVYKRQGGDIVSGMYALDFHKSDKICILLDLGTNGEIAIGNKDRLLVSSMAAGPAFEGGNIDVYKRQPL